MSPQDVHEGAGLPATPAHHKNFVDTVNEKFYAVEIKTGQSPLTTNQSELKSALNDGNKVELRSESRARDLTSDNFRLGKGSKVDGSFHMFRGDTKEDFQKQMAGFLKGLAGK